METSEILMMAKKLHSEYDRVGLSAKEIEDLLDLVEDIAYKLYEYERDGKIRL